MLKTNDPVVDVFLQNCEALQKVEGVSIMCFSRDNKFLNAMNAFDDMNFTLPLTLWEAGYFASSYANSTQSETSFEGI